MEPAATPDASAEPSTVVGSWEQLDDMSVARWSFAAVELPDGRVFVVDEEPCNGMSDLTGPPSPPRPADLLDPSSGRWTTVPAFGATRTAFATVALLDGRVLIAGGDNGWWGAYSSTKLYDPATAAWTAGTLMGTARVGPVAARLADGRVLVAGGTYSIGFRDEADFYARGANGQWPERVELTSAEILDPTTGRWSATGSLPEPVTGGTAFTLPDGRILAVGPSSTAATVTALAYDPAGGTWTRAGTVPWLTDSASALLGDGSLLVIGGTDGSDRSVATVRRFDPASGRTVEVARLPAPRSGAVAARLADGRVLLLGGSAYDGSVWSASAPATSTAFIYDPIRDTWAPTAPMPFADLPGQAVMLADGSIIVTGGSIPFEGVVVDACEPDAVGWTARFHLDTATAADGE